MADPLPFRARADAAPAFVAFLRKGEATRLYRIDPIGPSQWRCEIWFGAAIHRTAVTWGATMFRLRRDEFQREVTAAIADGWLLVE